MAHEVASYQASPGRTLYLGMEALVDLDHNLVDRNVLSIEPPMENVSIPREQASELLLVYGKGVMLVPFRLTYTLNTQFDNDIKAHEYWMDNLQATDAASSTATQQAQAVAARETECRLWVAGLAGAAVLLIAGWLIWRGYLRRRRNIQDADQ